MGRRVSSGVLPGGTGFTFFDNNTISTAEPNANLKFDADGTGIVESLKDLQITAGNLTVNAQGDLRLADSDSSAYVAFQAPATVSASYTVTMPAAVASRNNYALVSDNTGVTSWTVAQPFLFTVQTGSFSAEAWNCYFVDTSSSALTATLPASPTQGDSIRFFDVGSNFDVNALTISRNGKIIQGDAADMTVDSVNAAFELVFVNDTYGWRIFSI